MEVNYLIKLIKKRSAKTEKKFRRKNKHKRLGKKCPIFAVKYAKMGL